MTEITHLFAGTAHSGLQYPAHDFRKEMLFCKLLLYPDLRQANI